MDTENYLNFFRQGEYTLILEWLGFLKQKYSTPKERLEADVIIPLMTFELINRGFSKDDLSHIQLIFALINSNEIYFPAETEYAFTLLITAALQYQVFEKQKLLPFFTIEDNLDIEEIKQFMKTEISDWSSAENSNALSSAYTALEKGCAAVKKKVLEFKNRVLTMINYQSLGKDYLNKLTLFQQEVSTAERLGVVAAFSDYLNLQITLTPIAIEKIKEFLILIRGLHPFDWEEEYLSKFLEQSLFRQLYESSTKKMLFFAVSLVESLTEIPKKEEIKPQRRLDQ